MKVRVEKVYREDYCSPSQVYLPTAKLSEGALLQGVYERTFLCDHTATVFPVRRSLALERLLEFVNGLSGREGTLTTKRN